MYMLCNVFCHVFVVSCSRCVEQLCQILVHELKLRHVIMYMQQNVS